MPLYPFRPNHRPPKTHLKALLLNLGLSGSNGCRRIGVDKVASVLAGLEGCGLARADAYAAQVGTASGRTVGVVDTAASDELRAVALADVLCAGIVGLELSESCDSNWFEDLKLACILPVSWVGGLITRQDCCEGDADHGVGNVKRKNDQR